VPLMDITAGIRLPYNCMPRCNCSKTTMLRRARTVNQIGWLQSKKGTDRTDCHSAKPDKICMRP
jgi:hypothetical protein